MLAIIPIIQAPMQGILLLLVFSIFGVGAALFSVYFMTPWSLRKLPKIEEPPHEVQTMLAELTERSGLKKMPELKYVDTPEINAMVYSSIFGERLCLTTGIIDAYDSGSLSESEFRAVMAHEFGHIKNRDTLRFGLTLSWASLFETIGAFFILTAAFLFDASLFVGDDESDESDNVGCLIVFIGWIMLIYGFSSRFIAKIVSLPAFFISRTREFRADEYAAEIVGANAMASALQKIEDYNRAIIEEEIASLPYADRWQLQPQNPSWIDQLFNTHPTTRSRNSALDNMQSALE